MVVDFNPMAHVVGVYQDRLFFGRDDSVRDLSILWLQALAVLVLGVWVFIKLRKEIPDEV